MRAQRVRGCGVAVAVCLSWIYGLGVGATPARANMIGLTPSSPNCTAFLVDVKYTAATRLFEATGNGLDFDVDGVAPPDYSLPAGQYKLNVTIPATGLPTGGDLRITGSIPSLNATSGTLLTGTIAKFGCSNPPSGGEIFEFIFNVTGGDLASYYQDKAGVVLDAVNSNFKGLFNANFQNSLMAGNAHIYAEAVPEPSMLALLPCLAVAGAVVAARRRR